MGFEIPRSYERKEIREVAEEYLTDHFPGYPRGVEVPIDIELLLEKDGFRINVLPEFTSRAIGHEGALLWNKEEKSFVIYVTEKLIDPQRSYGNRYRYTLAEELGHSILHADKFKELETSDDAIEYYDAILAEDIKRMDREARYFAANILIPYLPLWEKIRVLVDILKEENKRFIDYNDFLGHTAKHFAELFEVSPESMFYRFKSTGVEHYLGEQFVKEFRS